MTTTPILSARVIATLGQLTLDLDLEVRGTLAVIGPNGAGKSTLLSLLLGAYPVQEGRIELAGTLLLDTAAGVHVPLEHRRLGFVPQDYALFPHMSVRKNLEFALESGMSRLSPHARSERALVLLGELGLLAHAERRPHTLSGGERQRVALARALCLSPRALLLDEPLAALDVHARREVREFLAGYLGKLSLPTVLVTHDAADARMLAQHIAVLEHGRITQLGGWDDLVKSPATRFVRDFVASDSY